MRATIGLFAFLLALSACGGGAVGVATSVNPASQRLATTPPVPDFYQPLAGGDAWTYRCRDIRGGGENGNRPFTIRNAVVGTTRVKGRTLYEFSLQIPQVPSSPLKIVNQVQLLANDRAGNVTIYGYRIGKAIALKKPALFVAANPPGERHAAFNYLGPKGGLVRREFLGLESSNPTPLGTFQVAPYFEQHETHGYGYAKGMGIVEEDHGPNFEVDCLIDSVKQHFTSERSPTSAP